MDSFAGYMDEYKKEMKKGIITKAYKGLMEYIMDLRTHFKNKYPNYSVSGLYYVYMDMTYFSFSTDSLKDRKLKIAIVFIHDTVKFEVWLSGQNKEIQSKYWKLFKDKNWNKYKIVPSIEGYGSIVEHLLIADPDFSNLDKLSEKIEKGTLKFIQDVEGFLEEN